MVTNIDRHEVQRLIREERAQLVEVLPEADYQAERITGAINIPIKKLDAEAAVRLDRALPVIVYCASST